MRSLWLNQSKKVAQQLLLGVLFIALIALGFSLEGCTSASNNSSAATSSGTNSSAAPSSKVVRIGTMPTEDILPMWVAEKQDMFKNYGVQAEIVVFDSAPALSAAITAGQVDLAMTDVMRAIKLSESGAPVVAEWITLGETPEQGRFGVLAPKDAPYSTLQELATYMASSSANRQEGTWGVGAAANTVPEYVFDMLVKNAGIEASAIPTVEVAALPERFSLTASGKLPAGAFPGSMLAMGEAQGMKLLADDTKGENISQSIMVARAAYAKDHEADIVAVAKAWDEASAWIAANQASCRELLVERARLNSAIAPTYPINTYPLALQDGGLLLRHPASNLVQPQITWMQEKGYGAKGVTYDATTGAFNFS